VLLDHAAAAGSMKDGCATGTLGNAIKQQLQQTDMLQQLAAVATAMAADLQAEAAALDVGVGAPADADMDRIAVADASMPDLVHMAALLKQLRGLWGSPAQPPDVNDCDWLAHQVE
jgi:hypothetical protein